MAVDLSPARLIRRARADSLTRNSVGIMGTSVVNAGLGYIYWTLAARLMPASSVGLGSAMVSAMVILSLAVHMGVGGGLTARLPLRTTRQQWLLTVLSALAACTAVTFALAAAVLLPLAVALKPLHALATDPALAAWFIVGAAGWTCSGLLDYVFIAQRRSDFMFLRNAVASGVKLAALIAVTTVPEHAASHAGAAAILATWSLSGLVGAVCGLIICHRKIHRLGRIRWRSTGAELTLLARPSLGHHAISVGGLIPTYLLPVVVTARLGTQENAYFYVTWMVGSSLFMISPAVASAIFAEGSHDDRGLRTLAARSLRIILAMVTPATLVIAAAGIPILDIFGRSYAHAGYWLLIVLLLSSFPDAVTNVAVATLRVRRRLRTGATLNGVMALISVGGAWVAAPHFGIMGAALAWCGSQTVGAVAVVVLHRYLWPPKETVAAASSSPDAATRHAVPAFADGAN
jgi:O-antigen/teichoic acid export membrane protein